MPRRKPIYQDDEFYLVLRNKTYHVFATVEGKRFRKSTGTGDLQRAKAFLENEKVRLLGGWRDDYDVHHIDWKDIAKKLYRKGKEQALKRGLPYDLKPGDIYVLMKMTGFRCAVSGIPFSKTGGGILNGNRDPWAPSVDRIENRHGYSLENCRVVCLAANIALSDWGMDVLLRLSRGIHRSSFLVAPELPSNEHSENRDPDKPLIHLVK